MPNDKTDALTAIFQNLEIPDPIERAKRVAAAHAQVSGILARVSFAEFVKQAWKTLEPSTQLEWNWHHQLMCDVLQAMFHAWMDSKSDRGRKNTSRQFDDYVRNAVFNVPPGSLKSRIIAVCFQPWCWLHEPGMKFICLSVNEDATLRDGRMSRDLIKSEWYQRTFHPRWQLRTDQDAISNYGNSSGGDRLSRAAGSEIVGLRGDCLEGSSKVLTEWGEIEIEKLRNWFIDGRVMPRVWAYNQETGCTELRKILATRRVKSSKTIVIDTEADNRLQCTDDHRIHTPNGYVRAKDTSEVSVMQWTDQTFQIKQTRALQRLSLCESGMYKLQRTVPTTWGRVRQENKETGDWAFLLEKLLVDLQPARNRKKLHNLQRGVSAGINEGYTSSLFDKVSGQAPKSENKKPAKQTLSVLPTYHHNQIDTPDVLRQNLRGSSSLYTNDGKQESTLQKLEELRRILVDESLRSNSGARRLALHSLRESGYETSTTGTSHKSRSYRQRAREFNYFVRRVSYDAPQIESSSVLSKDRTLEGGCDQEIYVYDLQIEGLHNFIANGILVHNCLLIDDPNNPKEAENKLEREKINQLWDTNIFNRVNDPRRSLRIGVQQRTNAGDWTGHVLKNQKEWSSSNLFGWLHVVLPAEFESARAYKTPSCLRKYMTWPGAVADDPRTKEGETIHEGRFTPEYLQAEKERWKNTNDYAGQMQQRPAALAGALVQRKWFGWFRFAKGVWEDKPQTQGGFSRPAMSHDGVAHVVNQKLFSPGEPDFDWITITVDPAAKKTEKGSQYGLLCVAGKGGKRYLLDDRTQRGAFHEIIDVIKEMVRTWKPDSLLIEPKAAGPDLMDTLREQMLSGDCPMVAIEEADPGNTDKEMRLQAALPYIKNGALYLLEGVNWSEFVEELCTFPAGENDDRVDALSQLLNQKREMSTELPSW